MKLNIPNQQFIELIQGKANCESQEEINAIVYDSRKIGDPANTVFFALDGNQTNGHAYIVASYDQGIRHFVVSEELVLHLKGAQIIVVPNVWNALFDLATFKRERFTGEVVAISGKAGKTTVKEWLYHFLSPEKKVSRSPKTYNSQLGIALSILELKASSEIGIIEIKPHEELDPVLINRMVKPTIGVWTSSDFVTGRHTSDSFISSLFTGVKLFVHSNEKRDFSGVRLNNHLTAPLLKKEQLKSIEADNSVNVLNASLAFCVAQQFVSDLSLLQQKLESLPSLALRMETFDGINGNFIINDTYNLDFDAFRNSLEFQQLISNGKKRAVLVGLPPNATDLKKELETLIQEYSPDFVQFISDEKHLDLTLENMVVLFKSAKNSNFQRLANRYKIKRHKTHIRIDLKNLRKNILAHKQLLPESTKIMAMMKAAGYGSGLQKMVQFVDSFGVDYYGVAYVDEGVEIRNAGIKKPIMVMNTEESNFEACILNNLEPAIYDFQQLDDFISECIAQGKEQYPIHVKINTGMNRLGFETTEIEKVLEVIQAQPEVKIRSVYSHLADADNRRDKRFTELQLQKFGTVVKQIQAELPYSFETHILNSSGIANYPQVGFSMIRIGIGMFGVSSNPDLKRKLNPVLSWYSAISQIRKIGPGQSVGYNRTFLSDKEMLIATIPVGYADGFRRSLSNGKGAVFIHGHECPVIGNVCMDMIMVDVSSISAKVGDEVEIIGTNQSIEKMAELQGTISYEIMTSISSRVHRTYVE